MKKPKRMKQSFTSPPKKGMGKVKSAGHAMGGMFGGKNPKSQEADMQPMTRSKQSSIRRARLANKFI